MDLKYRNAKVPFGSARPEAAGLFCVAPTLMGTTPKTLADAKAEAETAARLMLTNEHQKRLAGFGQSAIVADEEEALDQEIAHETI